MVQTADVFMRPNRDVLPMQPVTYFDHVLLYRGAARLAELAFTAESTWTTN